MSRSQRLSLLAIAAVFAAVAVVIMASGANDPADEQAASPPTTGTATGDAPATMAAPESVGMAEGEEAKAAVRRMAPLLTATGRPRTVKGTQGQPVSFRVRVGAADELHVHGYEISRALRPGKTAVVTIDDPEITGIFAIELHDADRQIGAQRIDPR